MIDSTHVGWTGNNIPIVQLVKISHLGTICRYGDIVLGVYVNNIASNSKMSFGCFDALFQEHEQVSAGMFLPLKVGSCVGFPLIATQYVDIKVLSTDKEFDAYVLYLNAFDHKRHELAGFRYCRLEGHVLEILWEGFYRKRQLTTAIAKDILENIELAYRVPYRTPLITILKKYIFDEEWKVVEPITKLILTLFNSSSCMASTGGIDDVFTRICALAYGRTLLPSAQDKSICNVEKLIAKLVKS